MRFSVSVLEFCERKEAFQCREQVKLAYEKLQELSDEVAAKPSDFFYSPSTGSRRFFVPNGEYEASRFKTVVESTLLTAAVSVSSMPCPCFECFEINHS
jgi:hypothetical protein